MTNQPAPAASKGKIPGIVIGLLIFIAACIIIPCCLAIGLYLLAPSVGDVFSGILSTIQAPIP